MISRLRKGCLGVEVVLFALEIVQKISLDLGQFPFRLQIVIFVNMQSVI
jgi:hypothetical protein